MLVRGILRRGHEEQQNPTFWGFFFSVVNFLCRFGVWENFHRDCHHQIGGAESPSCQVGHVAIELRAEVEPGVGRVIRPII